MGRAPEAKRHLHRLLADCAVIAHSHLATVVYEAHIHGTGRPRMHARPIPDVDASLKVRPITCSRLEATRWRIEQPRESGSRPDEVGADFDRLTSGRRH